MKAQYSLALMYAEGRGVTQDVVEAYKWLTLAEQGLQGTQHDQVIDRRDQIAKTMTHTQIEQGLQLAHEWKPSDVENLPYRTFSSSSVGKSGGSPVAGSQRVDMGSYVVSAPSGEGWKAQMDQVNGLVMFMRNIPGAGFTEIAVIQRALNPVMENKTRDEVVDAIQRFEEMNLKARGATRSYKPGYVTKATTTVGDKQVHVMNYVITDLSGRVPVEMKYAMYIYLPPDFKQARQVYAVNIGQPQKIGEAVFPTDLTGVLPVIDSFQIR